MKDCDIYEVDIYDVNIYEQSSTCLGLSAMDPELLNPYPGPGEGAGKTPPDHTALSQARRQNLLKACLYLTSKITLCFWNHNQARRSGNEFNLSVFVLFFLICKMRPTS